ncbi:MAG: LacI family DNA-binding transcriptional regulator [Chloroflexi bacterium]|nr:LacI family DNA-binding transcriptional regulator [Chloroflexota bacterium]
MARITIKDVAAHVGVSYQTVSKVLNKQGNVSGDTEARIWQAAADLGYKPNVSARNLRTQSSNLIGYAWQRSQDDSPRPILDQFLYDAVYTFEQHGYHLLTFLVDATDTSDVAIYKELYDRRQVEGYILADTNHNDPRIACLIEQGIPFASFGRANTEWDFCWVDIDGRHGLRIVADHLIERGHQRIGLLTWPEGSEAGAYREEGFADGLRSAGLAVRPDWVLRGSNTVQFGAAGMQHFRSLPAADRPTAVACVSDVIAIGALNDASAAGLNVGQDIAITGYDDIPMAQYFTPALTTVRQPIATVGQQVVDLLLKQIKGQPIAQKGILLKPELIIRQSS